MRNFRQRHRQPNGPLAARRGSGAPLAYPDGVPLSGASGSYIWCADSAGLSFSDDIEVVARVRCTDWSIAANQTLVGKYLTTGNQRSWRMYVNTAGVPQMSGSTNGTAVVTVLVTPSVSLVDNSTVWQRWRLDLTNGTNSVATIETAADAGTNDEPPSFSANGSNTGTALAGIFDSTAKLEIGAFNDGASERFVGRVYRVIVRRGFSGTTVADFDSRLSGAAGYTDAYGNVWTVSP